MENVDLSVVELRKSFIKYISNEYPECANVQIVANDALYPYRYNIGMDFWDIFTSNATIEKCHRLLIKRFQMSGDGTNFEQKATDYMYAINLLKSFFDAEHGGVRNYISLQANCASPQQSLSVSASHNRSSGILKSYCANIRMSYSYKPLLILAMIEYANLTGDVSLSSVAKYFIDYYSERRKNNFIVEKSNSLYFRGEVSLDEARKNIVKNPARVLAKDGIITLPDSSHLRFSEAALGDLEYDKEFIVLLCTKALKTYFDDLQNNTKSVEINSITNLDTVQKLAQELSALYKNASRDNKVTMIHLFGIRHMNDIIDNDISVNDILKAAEMPRSYQVEIHKGMNLAKYVICKPFIEDSK